MSNYINNLKKYTLEIVVFLSGAVVMIFELVGSRILGPYFGTSIFIWTSIIGIIMGSLSLGYYFGGKIADNNPSRKNLSLIIFLSAVFIGLTALIKDYCLIFLQEIFLDVRVSSVMAALILFSPASVCLGMVSPYAVKLKMISLETSAQTVGNLYAISTAGSIIGTFLSGFYLIPFFGTNTLLIILVLILIFTSLIIYIKELKIIKLFFLSIIIISFYISSITISSIYKDSGFLNLIDVDTAYNRIWIYDSLNKQTGQLVKVMGINNENHSSMFIENDKLVNEYTKYYHLASHFNANFKKTLMLGGAGYSYPKDFLSKYKDATIDVVEIDPKVTELAQKYFKLPKDSRLAIYHEDGRVYLNRTKEKYDVIFGDAFSSRYSLPYQLTTKEAVLKKYEILNDNGVVILNIISSIEGDNGKFLRAEYVTYASLFPQVYLFPVKEAYNGKDVQNIILVALKSEKKPTFNSSNLELNGYLKNLWKKEIVMDIPILTDDFAPVDYYISKAIF